MKMEITCSFQKRTGGVCGLDKRYKNEVVVPLSSCDRDIASHVRSVGVRDITSEIELILARSSVFSIYHAVFLLGQYVLHIVRLLELVGEEDVQTKVGQENQKVV